MANDQPPYRILVAEDQPENRLLLARLMNDLGLEVRTAVDGRECIRVFQDWQPHLIWMDMRMPVMDGYELTAELRRNDDLTPVIALTADAFPEREQECMAAGMNGRMIKPVSLQQLDSMLEKWLQPEPVTP